MDSIVTAFIRNAATSALKDQTDLGKTARLHTIAAQMNTAVMANARMIALAYHVR